MPGAPANVGVASSASLADGAHSLEVTAPKALTFECKLDKAAFKTCKAPAKFTKLKPGAHKVQLRAKDAAGNTSAAVTKSFKVKKAR